VIAAAVAAMVMTVVPASADPPTQPTYLEALQRAYDLIWAASPQDVAPARAALRVLEDGTDNTQPEILSDLRARPPLYDDATRRLAVLLAALNHPITSTDPALAQARLHDVMSMRRYDGLHRPPSLLDRFEQWIQDRINDVLRLLIGNRVGAQPAAIWFYVSGIVLLLLIAILFVRASRGRFKQSISLGADRPRPPSDYFAEADRLAAKGDMAGAIRALCAAVAATLAGEGAWAGSPLTVREIFQRAPNHKDLRPLLLPFEAAVYGGRKVDQATYERAAAVAAAFRRPREEAA
jgi:hypothetical protein